MKKCLYILTLALILLCTSISFAETVCEESEKEIIKKLGYGIVSEKKCTNERSRDLRQQYIF